MNLEHYKNIHNLNYSHPQNFVKDIDNNIIEHKNNMPSVEINMKSDIQRDNVIVDNRKENDSLIGNDRDTLFRRESDEKIEENEDDEEEEEVIVDEDVEEDYITSTKPWLESSTDTLKDAKPWSDTAVFPHR